MEKTKREYFAEIRKYLETVEGNEELVAFIDAEIARIDGRNEKAREKRAAKAAENDTVIDAIYAAIVDAEAPITADAIVAAIVEDYPEITKAKVTYRATKLVKAEKIYKVTVKLEDGRKAVAYTATAPETAETEAEE